MRSALGWAASVVARALLWQRLLTIRTARTAMRTMTTHELPFTEAELAFFDSDVEPIDACDLPFESLSSRVLRRFKALLSRCRLG